VAHAFKETQLDGAFLSPDMVLVRNLWGLKKLFKITVGGEFFVMETMPWKAGELRYPFSRAVLWKSR